MKPFRDRAVHDELVAEPRPGDHFVRLYGKDEQLIDTLRPFVAHGVGRGEGVALVITRQHRRQLEERLARDDFPLVLLQNLGRVVVVDAHYLLQRLLRGGRPDRESFFAAVAGLLGQARAGIPERPLRVFGELVNILWQDGDLAAALELESFWNEALEQDRFSLFCAYAVSGRDGHGGRFPAEACALHKHAFDPSGLAIPRAH